MSRKDEVMAYLEAISPSAETPTQIGMGLGYTPGLASGAVCSALKALVADGWAYRATRPVRYGKRGQPK